MDREKFNLNPAQLIIGYDQKSLENFAKNLCKKIFCRPSISACPTKPLDRHSFSDGWLAKSGSDSAGNVSRDNKSCFICVQIDENRHSNIIWITSEKPYKLSDIDVIFGKSAFALEENEKFFFVIENADLLNISCANRLLKIVEEPPAGYNFLFLTQRPQDILDTIKSRCTKIVIDNSEYLNEEPLIKYFTTEKIDASDFLAFIDRSEIHEQKTIIILDEILKFWTLKKESRKLDLIIESFENLPGPGGSKLFWKNFYTKFYTS